MLNNLCKRNILLKYLFYTTEIAKKNKVYSSSLLAVSDIQSGASILSGGFGPCGLPENLINALYERNVKNLKLVTNNPGTF